MVPGCDGLEYGAWTSFLVCGFAAFLSLDSCAHPQIKHFKTGGECHGKVINMHSN